MKVSKKTMNVTLRKATSDDVQAILEIVNHAIQNTTANYDYEPHTTEMQHAWFDDKTNSGFPVFVAEIDKKVAGFGTYGTFRFKFGYRFTVEHSVYVHEAYIGKGIGSQILPKLIELAKDQNLHMMIGGIDATNDASIRFHEKFGFRKCGLIPEVAYKFDRWLDLQFMALRLD